MYVKALYSLDSVRFCCLIMCVPYLINNIEAWIADIPLAGLVQSAFFLNQTIKFGLAAEAQDKIPAEGISKYYLNFWSRCFDVGGGSNTKLYYGPLN